MTTKLISATSNAPAGRRYTCSQIGSYAKAQVMLQQGHRYLDGDGDGMTCKNLQSEQGMGIKANLNWRR
jgi:hypothetical protein